MEMEIDIDIDMDKDRQQARVIESKRPAANDRTAGEALAWVKHKIVTGCLGTLEPIEP